MTREEAIEVYNGLINQKIKEAFEFFAPELKESEDERIRKMCITAVNIAASADGGLLHHEAKQCLDWLEKQKDINCLACDQHLKGYLAGRKVTEEEKQKENPKSADFIPSDCVSDAKCEDRSPKHSDSDGTDIRDTPAYWRGWDDAMKQKEHWNPTEEQLKALLNAEGYLREGDQFDSAKSIAQLYEQLKKL